MLWDVGMSALIDAHALKCAMPFSTSAKKNNLHRRHRRHRRHGRHRRHRQIERPFSPPPLSSSLPSRALQFLSFRLRFVNFHFVNHGYGKRQAIFNRAPVPFMCLKISRQSFFFSIRVSYRTYPINDASLKRQMSRVRRIVHRCRTKIQCSTFAYDQMYTYSTPSTYDNPYLMNANHISWDVWMCSSCMRVCVGVACIHLVALLESSECCWMAFRSCVVRLHSPFSTLFHDIGEYANLRNSHFAKIHSLLIFPCEVNSE